MSRSAGAGSPVYFICTVARREWPRGTEEHRVTLTGRERPYHRKRYSAKGSRSSNVAREYKCSCGHVGWSNHKDLEDLAAK